jgi:hypothetical protein
MRLAREDAEASQDYPVLCPNFADILFMAVMGMLKKRHNIGCKLEVECGAWEI